MRIWASLTKLLPDRQSKPMEAELMIGAAYRNVFTGSPTSAEREAVLADLAAKSGFYQVTVPSQALTDRDLWHAEGKRTLFAEIFRHLSLAPEDVKALENAARRESAFDTQYGFHVNAQN